MPSTHPSTPWRAAVAAFAVLAFGGSSCDEARPRVTLPIDSVVELRLEEDDSGILILARTRRAYGCLGYQILYRLWHVRMPDKEWALDLFGVRPPSGPCPTALGPAHATLSLGRLTEGPHPIALRVNEAAVTAVLTVTPDSLIVTGGDGPWTEWPEPAIAR